MSEIAPPTDWPHRDRYVRWLHGDGATGDPIEALLAEHHVMAAVLAAMEAEAERMLVGQPMRPQFWHDVVDFNGNFVHLCHRAKEEELLAPLMIANGLLTVPQRDALHGEHVGGGELTGALCDGIGEADWEKVLRLVSIYAHLMRPHMQREENGVFARAAALPAPVRDRLRGDCAEVERRVLGARGRRGYAAIAQRLAETAGVAHALGDEPAR